MKPENKKRIDVLQKPGICFIIFFLLELVLFAPGSFSQAGPNVSRGVEQVLPSLSLMGIIVSKNPSSSVAVLKDETTGKIVLLRVGESISGLILTDVFENRVILRKNENDYQIFLGKGKIVNVVPRLPEPPTEVSLAPQREEPVKREEISDAQTKEFIKSEVLKRLEEEWPAIVGQTRFVPNLVDGKISGFKILSFPQRSILSEIGIERNDIIREVNGVELSDMETLFLLYDKFRDENRFDVSIERDGRLVRMTYILK
jgi:general secretion pathway protein C